MKTKIMDIPDCEPEVMTKHSHYTISPPLEHDDVYPIHPDGQLAEHWLEPHPKILNEPFEPLLEELKKLDQGNPQVAQPAANILGLYSTLWESYSAKKAHSHRLETENKALRATNFDLWQEREFLEHRYVNQEAMLVYFEQAFENVRHGLYGIFMDWEGRFPEPNPEQNCEQNYAADRTASLNSAQLSLSDGVVLGTKPHYRK